METAPGLQPSGNRNMTVETLGIARLLPNLMTRQAFGQTFELAMWPRQRARRDLRRGNLRQHKQQENRKRSLCPIQ